MTPIYLDTSALAKLYILEPETPGLAKFLTQHHAPLPFTSLHQLELTHALTRRQNERALTAAQVASVHALLERDLQDGILHRPDLSWATVFERAIRTVRDRPGARSLDALHIGCALELNAEWFVTFDLQQSRAVKAVGLRIWPQPKHPS